MGQIFVKLMKSSTEYCVIPEVLIGTISGISGRSDIVISSPKTKTTFSGDVDSGQAGRAGLSRIFARGFSGWRAAFAVRLRSRRPGAPGPALRYL